MDPGIVAVIASCSWALAAGAALAWVLYRQQRSNTEIMQCLETCVAALASVDDQRPIGGLPPDLWKMEHDLKTREASMREKLYEMQLPLKEAEAKLRTQRIHDQMGRNTRTVRNPEA